MVGWGIVKAQLTFPASTAWSCGPGVVCLMVGWGTSKAQDTLPGIHRVVCKVLGVVWVMVGSGIAKAQATLPASTSWSTVTGGASSVVSRTGKEYGLFPTSFVALNRKSYSVLASSPENAWIKDVTLERSTHPDPPEPLTLCRQS